MTSRVPPHNIEAEEAILGAMLLTTEAIEETIEIITADAFYKPGNQHTYTAITAIHARGEPVDVVTVSAELKATGADPAVYDPANLSQMMIGTPAATNAERYAQLVYEADVRRRLVSTGYHITELGYETGIAIEEQLDEAERTVFDIAQGREAHSLARMHDLLGDTLDEIEAIYERGDAITGTPTGFHDLDKLTAGLQPSSLVVVGARPAMGKTAFALNLATAAALTHQRPTLVCSLEMSKIEISKRLLTSTSKVDATRLRDGRVNDQDWTNLAKAMGQLGKAPMWIDDDPQMTVTDIRSRARRLKSQVGDLGLVIVDYLQLMTGRAQAESRQVEISEISRGLKILARELECPVVALSQLSRGLESRSDKRPMLADLRESGAIEQDADVVMFIYRDEIYNPDSADKGQAEILIAKHRAGPTGVVRLAWLGHQTRFADMARTLDYGP